MLLPALHDLSKLLAKRDELAPSQADSMKARQLKGHVDDFLIPRAVDLESPLLVVILGSTGSGKSSLFNAIAGEPLSEVGVLRPTTRRAHALAPPDGELPAGLGSLVEGEAVEVIRRPSGLEHLVVIDAPDFDSIEAGNRSMARRLLEAADLIIFVTTDTRYADEVPWTVLARARERGLPVLTVINRLPEDSEDRLAVVDDYRRLLEEGGLSGPNSPSVEVIGVQLGELDEAISGLRRGSIDPVMRSLRRLVENNQERLELVRDGLARGVAGLPSAVGDIVADIEGEAQVRSSLLEFATESYETRRATIGDRIDRGSFLRSEVLREWQEFIGANRVAKVISEGVGRLAASIRSVFRPGPTAHAPQVREAAFTDLTALVAIEADRAASETARFWSRDRFGSEALAGAPELWGASPDLRDELHQELESWGNRMTREMLETREKRRGLAKAASLGVNVVGTGAILAVFAQTGGLTGAEAGIAAVTAVVNQTLLEAIFGEANVARMVSKARDDLDEIIQTALLRDRDRFEDALGLSAELKDLAGELKQAALAAVEGAP